MTNNAELEYAKLLESEKVNKALIEHPQFYRSFIREYENATLDGKYPVDINIGTDSITMSRRGNYPDATNGIYYGVKDINSYKFSLETLHDRVFLRIEHDNSTVYTFPQKGDSLSTSRDVQIFEDNALLGRAYFYNGSDYYGHGQIPYLGFTVPEGMSVGYILDATLPDFYRIAGNYDYQVSGRTSYESGIIDRSRQTGRANQHTTTRAKASVNLENTFSIDNASDYVTFDSKGQVVSLNSNFSTVDEASRYFQERYSEAIGKGKLL